MTRALTLQCRGANGGKSEVLFILPVVRGNRKTGPQQTAWAAGRCASPKWRDCWLKNKATLGGLKKKNGNGGINHLGGNQMDNEGILGQGPSSFLSGGESTISKGKGGLMAKPDGPVRGRSNGLKGARGKGGGGEANRGRWGATGG